MSYTPHLEVILKELNIIILSFRMTRRYGPLRGPPVSSCGGLWPSAKAFSALWDKSSKKLKNPKKIFKKK